MPSTDALVRIGEFARRARLPVSTLRYYDRIGLLAPARTDAATGYRWYGRDQLPVARRIADLRAAGLGPDGIRRVLDGGAAARATLLRERDRLASEIDEAGRRMRYLDGLLLGSPSPEYAPAEVVVAPRRALTMPFTVPHACLETGIREAIRSLARRPAAGRTRRAGSWGAVLPLDLGAHVTGKVYAPPAGSGEWLPSGPAMEVEHHGPIRSLPDAYAALFDEIDRRGRTACGPVCEDYDGYLADDESGRVRIRVLLAAGAVAPSPADSGACSTTSPRST